MNNLSIKIKFFLIYFIIFLIIIFLLNWLIKSSQAVRNKSQEENFSVYYKELLGRCDKDEKNYDCCFNSIAYTYPKIIFILMRR